MDVLKNVRYGNFSFRKELWKEISKEAKTLIKQMLTVNPEERIKAEDAMYPEADVVIVTTMHKSKGKELSRIIHVCRSKESLLAWRICRWQNQFDPPFC